MYPIAGCQLGVRHFIPSAPSAPSIDFSCNKSTSGIVYLSFSSSSVTRSAKSFGMAVPRLSSRALSSPLLSATRHHPFLPPRHLSTALPPSSEPSRPSGSRRLLWSTGLLSLGLLSGYSLSLVLPRPRWLSLIFPVPTSHPPPKDHPEYVKITKEIEDSLQALPLVRNLRAQMIEDPTTPMKTSLTGEAMSTNLVKAYTESRPYATSTPGPHSLSAYTLRGPGKFAVAPLVFTNKEKTESVFFMHVGSGLCGHEGVIHGGLLATVMDESLARTAFYSLPNQIGVTATLTLKYRKPTFANQFIVIKTSLVRADGRKVWTKGRIEDLDGTLLVEAEGLFVEPRGAQFLKSSTVREALK